MIRNHLTTNTCSVCQRIVYPADYSAPYCPFRVFTKYYDEGGVMDSPKCDQYVPSPLEVLTEWMLMIRNQMGPITSFLMTTNSLIFYSAVFAHIRGTGGQTPWLTGTSYISFDWAFTNWERWLRSTIEQ